MEAIRRRTGHGLLALLLVLGALLGMSAAPAGACACGAMADPEGDRSDASVQEETAVLSLRDGTETIILSLELDAEARGATLIMPTPSVPTVAEGDPSTLRELAVATAPRQEQELDWWGTPFWLAGSADGGGAPGAAAPTGAARIHSQQRLGAFEVVVLDGTAEAVSGWLAQNGYVLEESVLALLPAYAEDGWTFTAVRYAEDVDVSADVSPLRFDFPATELVYPMRLSQAASQEQQVHLFVLGEEPVRRSDGSAAQQSVERPWIANPAHLDWTWSDDTLRELTADAEGRPGGAMVTEFRISGEPSSFTSDMTFATDSEDPWVVPTRTVTVPVEVAGIPAGWLLVVAGGLLVVLTLYGVGATAAAVRARRR
ncbi:DUF2330 domain-containing protein [Brachybacterium hainanense]|uniref:DUF2330 domain-containing protein n=1 Tax=Brachybacterium hainanense TaxID=1541174 RepID=A0ABV6RDK2_9MICO